MEKFQTILKKEKMTYNKSIQWFSLWCYKNKNKIITKCKLLFDFIISKLPHFHTNYIKLHYLNNFILRKLIE